MDGVIVIRVWRVGAPAKEGEGEKGHDVGFDDLVLICAH